MTMKPGALFKARKFYFDVFDEVINQCRNSVAGC